MFYCHCTKISIFFLKPKRVKSRQCTHSTAIIDPLICSILSNIMLLAWNEKKNHMCMFLVGLSHWISCYLECASAWGFVILHLDITAAMMMMWVQIENRPSHSHAPIEASKRNPSRRLMQTVSSNPPSNPQWSMKQLRGLQLHKLRFMHLSTISVYISIVFFFFFKL